jgi:hypothetical protein
MSKKYFLQKAAVFVSVLTVCIFGVTFSAFAEDNTGRSAEATYSVVAEGNTYNYTVQIRNTSTNANDSIYQVLIGSWFDEPVQSPLPLQNVAVGNCPEGWISNISGGEVYGGYYLGYSASRTGSAQASHYIMSGETATFSFTTTNSLPAELKFGVNYYNGQGTWGGTSFNGTAHLTDNTTEPVSKLKKIITNSKSLLIKTGASIPLPKIEGIYKDKKKADITSLCKWESKNENIVRIENGHLIGVKEGQTMVTASLDSKKINIQVKVQSPKKISCGRRHN